MPLDPARQGARKRRALQEPTPRSRRLYHFGLLFIASVLVANALVGERGLVDSIAAGRRHAQLTREITGLRHENERLRREAHRLREDPGTIEEVAREELGLIRPGELLLLFASRHEDDSPGPAPTPRRDRRYEAKTSRVR